MAIAIGTRWYRLIYVQVLIAIVIGILVGWLAPETGKALKPLGDGFIALIKMMIAPVIFCTVVHGIGAMGDLKRVGRVGARALIYFEVVSTVALAVGIAVGMILRPGHGFDIDPSQLNAGSVSSYVTRAQHDSLKTLRTQQQQLFTQTTVDANAAEALSVQMSAVHDQVSKRMLQAMIESSRVLTPDQRKQLAERMTEMRSRMERHRNP